MEATIRSYLTLYRDESNALKEVEAFLFKFGLHSLFCQKFQVSELFWTISNSKFFFSLIPDSTPESAIKVVLCELRSSDSAKILWIIGSFEEV